MMEALLQDLRHAVRRLGRSPGFTLLAVTMLGLGIGVNTAAFSVANWVLLRPVPGVAHPDELAILDFPVPRGPRQVSELNYQEFSQGVPAFTSLAGHYGPFPFAIAAGNATPRLAPVELVTANYFATLGVTFLLGSSFTSREENTVDLVQVAVLSHRVWGDLFGADPEVVGKTLRINGHAFRVVGVTDKGFDGVDRTRSTDLWIPGPAMASVLGRSPERYQTERNSLLFWELIGRLASRASPEQAQTQAALVMRRLLLAYPDMVAPAATGLPRVTPGVGLAPDARGRVRSAVRLLSAVSAFVLFIACANLANLLLSRGLERRQELALRRAIGASAGRLVLHHVAESGVLFLCSGVAAIALAAWLLATFNGPFLSNLTSLGTVRLDDVRIDWRVLVFTIGTVGLLGTMVGLVPAFWSGADSPIEALKWGSARVSRPVVMRSALAVVQLAVAVPLLIGAMLFIFTLNNLEGVDIGFDAARVTTYAVDPRRGSYSDAQAVEFVEAVAGQVRAIPGVENASVVQAAPFAGVSFGDRVWNEGLSSDRGIPVRLAWASPTYFETVGIPFVHGRSFNTEEARKPLPGAEAAIVINESLAKALYGAVDPVGRSIRGLSFAVFPRVERPLRIVGVVRDSRWEQVTEAAGPFVYYPVGDRGWTGGGITILVRTGSTAIDVRPSVNRIIAALAPSLLPVTGSATISERVEETLAEERLFAVTTTLLAVLAAVLSSIGLYALMAATVANRKRELGIRIALGAQAKEILDLIVRQGALLTGLGVVLGLGGAVGLSRLIASRLFGVAPLEPYIFILATALLVLIALAASVIPARAATRVDPMIALRSE